MMASRLPRFLTTLAVAALFVATGCGDNPDPGTTTDVGVAPEVDVDVASDVEEDTAEESDAVEEDTGIDAPPEDAGGEDTETDAIGEDTEPDSVFNPDTSITPDADPDPAGPLGLLTIDPSSGPESGDTPVILFGYGFTVDTEILVNGRLAYEVDFVDSETILARFPANPAGIYDVKVANATEEALLVQGFSYFANLRVDAVEPSAGPERGGMPLTVYGAGFTDDSLVSVGGRLGIDTNVNSAEEIEFILPPGVEGTADVRVTNATGSQVLPDGFSYYAEPAISAITPAAGRASGGYTVTISGVGFTDDAIVRFGPSVADSSFVDGSTLEVTVPAGIPGPADVSVSSAIGGDTELGGFWYVADPSGALAVESVVPNTGSSAGGFVATVAGPSVGDANTVQFGTEEATILARYDGAVTVTVPPGTGVVDVLVETDAETATLFDGFTYLAALEIDSVSPDVGETAGGDVVTISGAGFDETVGVRFGPIRAADVTVESDSSISVVTPPGSLGRVDVEVFDRSRSATLEDGYLYLEAPDVTAVTPSRGAIAGNTRVIIRGRGFYGDVEVLFGDYAAAEVTIIDAATLEVRTPEVPEAERVAVTVIVDGEEVRTGKNFVFYDPFSPAGGWWGDEINGSVNVTVIDSGNGARVPDAFVTLHVRVDDAAHTCTTNANGQCTISEIDVTGIQIVSASALDYSAVTVTDVDAENIVIALSSTVPPTPGTPPAYTPPLITGTLAGLDKIVDPAEDEVILGVIRTTTPGVGASNPPGTGIAQVAWASGAAPLPFEMASREGELAVVAICGVFNETTGDFRPEWMGIERGMAVRGEGTIYEVEIECDIRMDQTMTFKFRNPPLFIGGPDTNQAIPYLDFGGEGATDLLRIAEGPSEIIVQDKFVPLDNPALAGVNYEITGQSVPSAGGLPFSIVYARGVTNPDERIDFPTSMPPADLVYPSPGGTVVERRFEWELSTDEDADFYYAYIQDLAQEITFWEVWLPGDQLGFNLPYFPPGEGSVALPAGPLVLIVLSIDAITFDYDAFEFNDFGAWNWRAYSAAGWVFNNPG